MFSTLHPNGGSSTVTVELEAPKVLRFPTALPPNLSAQMPENISSTASSSVLEIEDKVEKEYPTWRKVLILITVSWMTLAATFSSTSLFPAIPEIAEEYDISQEVISASNAGVLVAMGMASLIWAPLSSMLGRKIAYNLAIFIFFGFSIGAAASKSFGAFVAMRTLAGFEASYFMVAGQAVIADIFPPARRGTAVGFFMSGTVTGPALGPCIGGILVTFTSWRVIFWLQAGMAAAGFLAVVLLVPNPPAREVLAGNQDPAVRRLFASFNPLKVFSLMVHPNILLTDMACGLLSWTMYSLLTPPRALINPRFHLTTPLVSGLFYIAPGAGFLLGTIAGGRWADMTVKRYIKRRNGLRLPQDRLNSGMLAFFVLLPVSCLIYGWCLEYTKGGLPVPAISIFFAGVGLMTAFSSLNTYCAEVIPSKRMEVMASKYLLQYACSAAGSASALPLVDSIGVGLTCTICSIFVAIAGGLVFITAQYGERMQRRYEQWWKAQRARI